MVIGQLIKSMGLDQDIEQTMVPLYYHANIMIELSGKVVGLDAAMRRYQHARANILDAPHRINKVSNAGAVVTVPGAGWYQIYIATEKDALLFKIKAIMTAGMSRQMNSC